MYTKMERERYNEDREAGEMDKRKKFINSALQNGYTRQNCNGWEWIKDNLSMLDDYFQREDYKKCNHIQYKCMLILMEGIAWSAEEENLLTTAWYLNNKRERETTNREYHNKMVAEGWQPLTEEIIKKAIEENKKIELDATQSRDWMTFKVNKILKPCNFGADGYGLMPPRSRTRGYLLTQFKNAFVKLI